MSSKDEDANPQAGRYMRNVVWNWMGVGFNLLAALTISPYLIRKLGTEGYGVWSLTFALFEYYTIFDFGFRSATVKYVGHYYALGNWRKLEQVVNTSVAYAALIGVVLMGATFVLSAWSNHIFKVSEKYHEEFPVLLLLLGLIVCSGMVFQLFSNSLEGIQRFDLSNKVYVVVTGIKSVLTLVILMLGYGMIPLGVGVFLSQCVGYGLHYWNFRRTIPEIRLQPWKADRETWKQLLHFGIPSFGVNFSGNILMQGPPVLIGNAINAQAVGYYNLPMRLLQYAIEGVGRISLVTGANTAAMVARGEKAELWNLARYPSRYSVTLMLPLMIFLSVYGRELFRIWIGEEIARESVEVLWILMLGNLIAVVGQSNAGMMLLAMAEHRRYALGMMVEMVLAIGAIVWVIPVAGVKGVAMVTAGLMVLNRGIYLPFLLSQALGKSWLQLQVSIFGRAVAVGLLVLAMSWWFKTQVLPGKNWGELILVGFGIGVVYYSLAYRFCLLAIHRQDLTMRISGMFKRWQTRR